MTVSRRKACSVSLYSVPEHRNQSLWPWPCRQLDACELWLWWELSVCMCVCVYMWKTSGYYRVGAITTRQTLNVLLPLVSYPQRAHENQKGEKKKKKSSVSNMCRTEGIYVLIESSLILAWVEVTLQITGVLKGEPLWLVMALLKYHMVGARWTLEQRRPQDQQLAAIIAALNHHIPSKCSVSAC